MKKALIIWMSAGSKDDDKRLRTQSRREAHGAYSHSLAVLKILCLFRPISKWPWKVSLYLPFF